MSDIHQRLELVHNTSNYLSVYDSYGKCLGTVDCYDERRLKEFLWSILNPRDSKVNQPRIHGEGNEIGHNINCPKCSGEVILILGDWWTENGEFKENHARRLHCNKCKAEWK